MPMMLILLLLLLFRRRFATLMPYAAGFRHAATADATPLADFFAIISRAASAAMLLPRFAMPADAAIYATPG